MRVQQAPVSTSFAWQVETLPKLRREVLMQRGSPVRSETSWYSVQEGKEKPSASHKGSCPVLELLLADAQLKSTFKSRQRGAQGPANPMLSHLHSSMTQQGGSCWDCCVFSINTFEVVLVLLVCPVLFCA